MQSYKMIFFVVCLSLSSICAQQKKDFTSRLEALEELVVGQAIKIQKQNEKIAKLEKKLFAIEIELSTLKITQRKTPKSPIRSYKEIEIRLIRHDNKTIIIIDDTKIEGDNLFDQVYKKLKLITTKTPNVSIILNPDQEIPHSDMIFVLTACRKVSDGKIKPLNIRFAEITRKAHQNRLVISIDKNGKFSIAGQLYNRIQLNNFLQLKALANNKEGVSNLSVLISASTDVPYKIIQDVMMLCAKNKIYKLSFAAKSKYDKK